MADGESNQPERPHLYRLTYNIQPRPEGVSAEEVPRGSGACDAILICSMTYPEDGSFSLGIRGLDGRTGDPVPDEEVFKVWSMMAKQLSESRTLPAGRRSIAATVFEIIRAAILESTGRGSKKPGRD